MSGGGIRSYRWRPELLVEMMKTTARIEYGDHEVRVIDRPVPPDGELVWVKLTENGEIELWVKSPAFAPGIREGEAPTLFTDYREEDTEVER